MFLKIFYWGDRLFFSFFILSLWSFLRYASDLAVCFFIQCFFFSNCNLWKLTQYPYKLSRVPYYLSALHCTLPVLLGWATCWGRTAAMMTEHDRPWLDMPAVGLKICLYSLASPTGKLQVDWSLASWLREEALIFFFFSFNFQTLSLCFWIAAGTKVRAGFKTSSKRTECSWCNTAHHLWITLKSDNLKSKLLGSFLVKR